MRFAYENSINILWRTVSPTPCALKGLDSFLWCFYVYIHAKILVVLLDHNMWLAFHAKKLSSIFVFAPTTISLIKSNINVNYRLLRDRPVKETMNKTSPVKFWGQLMLLPNFFVHQCQYSLKVLIQFMKQNVIAS